MANIVHCSYCIIRYEIHLQTACVAAFMLILYRNMIGDICFISCWKYLHYNLTTGLYVYVTNTVVALSTQEIVD